MSNTVYILLSVSYLSIHRHQHVHQKTFASAKFHENEPFGPFWNFVSLQPGLMKTRFFLPKNIKSCNAIKFVRSFLCKYYLKLKPAE